MKMEWNTDSFAMTGLDDFAAEMLRRLPGCASVDDEAVRARIFPPLTGGKDEEADADWRDSVEPDLREAFASHVDVVVSDLARIEPGDEGDSLTVPVEHVGAWIHTLNQARLALGERHHLNEENLNDGILPDQREDFLAMVEVEFYGGILAFLLHFGEL